MVYCDELPEHRRFDESKIKDITSHDRQKGRFIYERSIEFYPTHKLWMYGNHRPVIAGQDEGIWRRIRMIPFTVVIPKEKKRPAEEMKAEFREEASGILHWALEGFYLWRHGGRLSNTPACITGATNDYRSEMDTIGSFINEEIEEMPGKEIPHKVLYERYRKWCIEQGIQHTMTSRKLSRFLRESKHWKGVVDRKCSQVWQGRQLRIEAQIGMSYEADSF
jgi:putative DNA primase/helicase